MWGGSFALEIQVGEESSASGNPSGREGGGGLKKVPIHRVCVDFFWNNPGHNRSTITKTEKWNRVQERARGSSSKDWLSKHRKKQRIESWAQLTRSLNSFVAAARWVQHSGPEELAHPPPSESYVDRHQPPGIADVCSAIEDMKNIQELIRFKPNCWKQKKVHHLGHYQVSSERSGNKKLFLKTGVKVLYSSSTQGKVISAIGIIGGNYPMISVPRKIFCRLLLSIRNRMGPRAIKD